MFGTAPTQNQITDGTYQGSHPKAYTGDFVGSNVVMTAFATQVSKEQNGKIEHPICNQGPSPEAIPYPNAVQSNSQAQTLCGYCE